MHFQGITRLAYQDYQIKNSSTIAQNFKGFLLELDCSKATIFIFDGIILPKYSQTTHGRFDGILALL